MMGKYTPGEWVKIAQKGLYVGNYAIGIKGDDGMLKSFAAVYGPNGFGGYPEDAEANANLIIAGPDLLEACKEVWEAYLDLNSETSIPAEFKAMEMIEAAIAKAEPKPAQQKGERIPFDESEIPF